jgi:pimeloyl-ACP methyl ester carboxylesterase
VDRVAVDGSVLEYEVWGTGDPVVLIHGVLVADAFRPLLAEPSLADRYRLILYHRRGYAGSSRASQPVSVGRQAADCHALLRHLGVERAHVAGHSYGGAVALQLALDAPAVVHSVALLEPALIAGVSAQGYRESLVRAIERYWEVGATIVVDEFLQTRWPGYGAALDRALPEAFAQAVVDAGTTFECELPGLLDWRFGEVEARSIGQPALCVLGSESEVLWPRFGETHRLLLEWMPHAEGCVLSGTTHFLPVENPRGTAEVLSAFWVRHRLPAAQVT